MAITITFAPGSWDRSPGSGVVHCTLYAVQCTLRVVRCTTSGVQDRFEAPPTVSDLAVTEARIFSMMISDDDNDDDDDDDDDEMSEGIT